MSKYVDGSKNYRTVRPISTTIRPFAFYEVFEELAKRTGCDTEVAFTNMEDAVRQIVHSTESCGDAVKTEIVSIIHSIRKSIMSDHSACGCSGGSGPYAVYRDADNTYLFNGCAVALTDCRLLFDTDRDWRCELPVLVDGGDGREGETNLIFHFHAEPRNMADFLAATVPEHVEVDPFADKPSIIAALDTIGEACYSPVPLELPADLYGHLLKRRFVVVSEMMNQKI